MNPKPRNETHGSTPQSADESRERDREPVCEYSSEELEAMAIKQSKTSHQVAMRRLASGLWGKLDGEDQADPPSDGDGEPTS